MLFNAAFRLQDGGQVMLNHWPLRMTSSPLADPAQFPINTDFVGVELEYICKDKNLAGIVKVRNPSGEEKWVHKNHLQVVVNKTLEDML